MMFGERLRQLRQQRGFQLLDLAEKIGVRDGTLSQWERQKTLVPTAERIGQICEALDCLDDELELLILASRERGKVCIDVSEQSQDALQLFNHLEESARRGKLNPRVVRKLVSILVDVPPRENE